MLKHNLPPPQRAGFAASIGSALFCLTPWAVGSVFLAIFVGAAAFGYLRGTTPALTEIFRLLPGSEWIGRLVDALPRLLLYWACAGCAIEWIAVWREGSAWARRWRRRQSQLTRALRRSGIWLAIGLCCLTLAWIWSPNRQGAPSYDYSSYSALLGHIPWSDAHGYYCGAHHLSATGGLHFWSERRPLNAALLTVRLAAAAADLDTATLLQTIFLAVALYAAAWSLGSRLGIWAGLAAFALLLGYSRAFLATTLSETLGITLGALGFALLFQSLRSRHLLPASLGLFGLALGMSARAGAMFMLPAMALWTSWHFRGAWPAWTKASCAAVIATALGMGSDYALVHLYGSGESSVGANFAYTLCGLACGTSWDGAQKLFAEELRRLPNEKAQTDFMYAKACERIKRQPTVFLTELWRSEASCAREMPFFMHDTISQQATAASRWIRRLDRLVFLGAGLGVLLYLWRGRRSGDLLFWLAAASGFWASIPFIFLDGGWRVVAVSWPFVVGLIASGLSSPRGLLTPAAAKTVRQHQWLAGAVLIAAAVAALVGPSAASRLASSPLTFASREAIERSDMLIRGFPKFAAVGVVDQGQAPLPGVPTVELPAFIKMIQRGGIEDEKALLVPQPPEPPFIIGSAYDYLSGETIHILGPTELLTPQSPFLRLRTEPWRGSPYFRKVTEVVAAP